MATREENLQKINEELEKLSDDELEQVAGGSFRLTEEQAKKYEISLIKEDGSPGEFGYLWNTGDYYWHHQKISNEDIQCIKNFVNRKGYQPNNLREAKEFGAFGRRHR